MPDYDVIVVGAGNAALAAGVSARENGAERVLALEKAPIEMRGGNTHWSGGLLRIAFNAPRALERLVPDVEDHLPGFFDDVEPYTATKSPRGRKKAIRTEGHVCPNRKCPYFAVNSQELHALVGDGKRGKKKNIQYFKWLIHQQI